MTINKIMFSKNPAVERRDRFNSTSKTESRMVLGGGLRTQCSKVNLNEELTLKTDTDPQCVCSFKL